MVESPYPTIITFYTNTWEYKTYAMKMQKDCKKFNLQFYSKEYPTTGHWILNTAIKPRFILETLLELKRPVLWIDADGTLWRKPDHLIKNFHYDFAARRQNNPSGRQWHVGTLYFNYTEASINFLKLWVESCEQNPGSDEGALDLVWKNKQDELSLRSNELPETYFEMFVKLDQKPLPKTVISHRASRCPNKLEAKKRWQAKNPQ